MSELKEKGLGVFINLDKWGISTFTLKIIAMITMIITPNNPPPPSTS